jgi:hypothetical protein
MTRVTITRAPEIAEGEWITFPGGELEGRRPRALCPACRQALRRTASGPSRTAALLQPRPLCFQCYRTELARERALAAAGEINTASEARFQCTLPFEPVNRARLDRLRAERALARADVQAGAGRYADRRRHAQIEARHALQRIAEGLRAHRAQTALAGSGDAEAIHAAELQLPDAWLPFVVSR